MADSTTSRRLRVYRSVVCVYWASEFVATHTPITEQVDQLPGTDKHLHFGAYFVLAAMLMFWNGSHSSTRGSRVFRVVVALAVYAAVDELLQPLVGRKAELLDWVADVFGAAVGAAAVLALMRMFRAWSADKNVTATE